MDFSSYFLAFLDLGSPLTDSLMHPSEYRWPLDRQQDSGTSAAAGSLSQLDCIWMLQLLSLFQDLEFVLTPIQYAQQCFFMDHFLVMENAIIESIDIATSSTGFSIYVPLPRNRHNLTANDISLLARTRWTQSGLPHFDPLVTRLDHSLLPEDTHITHILDSEYPQFTSPYDVFRVKAVPPSYSIDTLGGLRRRPIPRRQWVAIEGIDFCCWLDKIIKIDVDYPSHVIMQGWQYEHYHGRPPRIAPFWARISNKCLSLPQPWSSIQSLGLLDFIHLAMLFDDNLYGLYKELQRHVRFLNGGEYKDANLLERMNNWLGLFDELQVYDVDDDGSEMVVPEDFEDLEDLEDEDEEDDEDMFVLEYGV
ncbi:hypothetical protein OE88DRAFT_1641303 [Heliocybe sulcata]|uniref:Uncharacterized protein n=1 Tax=Heliocybe sulcata TaxID=5364 RepID=A0A5C3NDD1_9AGAM|nr:hypothetical protein OE88DRAFT_1641303 [Heliocybe sulcata]